MIQRWSRVAQGTVPPEPKRKGCPGHGRHWFTLYGCPGARTPVCVRCGAPNPRPLTTDEWYELRGQPGIGHHVLAALSRHFGGSM